MVSRSSLVLIGHYVFRDLPNVAAKFMMDDYGKMAFSSSGPTNFWRTGGELLRDGLQKYAVPIGRPHLVAELVCDLVAHNAIAEIFAAARDSGRREYSCTATARGRASVGA